MLIVTIRIKNIQVILACMCLEDLKKKKKDENFNL